LSFPGSSLTFSKKKDKKQIFNEKVEAFDKEIERKKKSLRSATKSDFTKTMEKLKNNMTK
jgi:hypothetical protein